MVENFVAYNPVKLHFGKNVVEELGNTVRKYGKKVLLVYGKGSVKKYGYYDEVVEVLRDAGLDWVEYYGIKPNPVIEDVRKATVLAKENNVDVVVALGGGSVIDSAKIIAVAVSTGIEPWDIVSYKTLPESTLPLVCILTLAATGTEMNMGAVVQNKETKAKIGFVNPLLFPKESFLDPKYTLTVPSDHTTYGIVDLIAHALEAYFGAGEPAVIDVITLNIIKDAVRLAPDLLNDLTNYELRAEMMLDATLALNGLTMYGKKGGDWGVHSIGHEISLLFDTPHGATLSIVYPAWLRYHKNKIQERILKMGELLFESKTADEAINSLEDFFISINSPVRLTDIGLQDKTDDIIKQLIRNKVSGINHKLNYHDLEEIVSLCR
jgi:alcohol dehydrogenase YqhD (iron-dependent ADH family)